MAEPLRGFTLFFTGLSASGKSTLAETMRDRLSAKDWRPVTLLDGDALRRQVSADLGYGKADRDEHVRRVSRAAADITGTGGIAICALIAPYDQSRKEGRAVIEAVGGFVLVHLSTPIAVCEARDPKGLYARARTGSLEHFTGVSDPYEVPTDAELTIDTSSLTPAEAAGRVENYLRSVGWI